METGTSKKLRPELAAAIAAAKKAGATLVIAKLDRLTRNVAFVSKLMEAKVEFVAVDMPTDNRLTNHIIAAMAEHGAEMISALATLSPWSTESAAPGRLHFSRSPMR